MSVLQRCFEIIEYLAEHAPPDVVLGMRASDDEQREVDSLLERNKRGRLSDEQAEQLDQILELERVFMLIKAKAAVAKKENGQIVQA